MKTHTHGYVNRSINRATADGPAGLGKLHSTTATRRSGLVESMRNADKTEFHDTIAIFGEPECCIPIGLATFRCEVSGDWRQPRSGASVTGNAAALATFGAQAAGAPVVDRQQWNFPSLIGPQLQPVTRTLTVAVLFVIGQPIQIFATLNTDSRERTRQAALGDLDARLELQTRLQPIQVEWVTGSSASTLTASQTKYYTEDEAGGRDVPLRAASVVLQHA